MGKKPLEFAPPEGRKDFENLSVEYRMKLIAYQDEIFRAKKKLQESDIRMTELQKKLDNYLRNKENQLAEVMFTAHTNAQRIEAQARSQIQYYLDEMELELQRKMREIEIVEEKTRQFDQAIVTPSEPLVDAEPPSRLKVVEGGGGESEPTRKIEKLDIKPEQALPTAQKKMKVSSKKTKPSQPQEVVDKVVPPAKLPRVPAKDAEIKQAEPEKPLVTDAIIDVPAEPVATEEAAAPPVMLAEDLDAVNVMATDLESPAAVEPPVAEAQQEEPLPEQALDEAPAPEAAEEAFAEAAVDESVEEILEETVVDETLEEIVEETVEEILEETVEESYMEETEPEPELEAELEPEPELEPEQIFVPPAAKQVEINERMQLDAFIDVRYFNDITGTKELYHHALQITIEVDVPADNYSVRYTKVSSDVVSTLMKYDNVVLNDLFPFNFIAPNPNSIATYFFNLLDDMLQIMDLRLHKMTMTEFPDMCIVVDQRNTAFDNMLHKGDDLFEDIRNSLPACVEAEPRESSPIKGTLSKLLKKRI